ncbi:PEPxxWA-CTERM sorting domain-containing protein [Sphingobium boeckii]|uniref:Ice-binding protein C-terminal domain-containing protein n=1 Tax=Sphingobium boeckii TaxID=1082345 RepID=A0A7W9AI96_9SPHN|nr:PEPxxWA-CTERM sorting domain-containing protein [Sphingobium boeckii]MBB5686198.1 hypothetical protein [Sphingobium boeckii]
MSCLPVQAATLIGKTVKVEFYSPNLNWIDSSFVHTAGVSDDMLLFDILVSRFTEGSFVLDALSAINFLSAEFNGFRIFDSNNELNAFTSVTLSGLSTHPYIATFDPERITFDADNIYINLQGTGIRGGRNLIFDIETAAGVVASEIPAAVPEPATWAMMLAGFGLIGSAMRSRVPAGGCAAHSATMA